MCIGSPAKGGCGIKSMWEGMNKIKNTKGGGEIFFSKGENIC